MSGCYVYSNVGFPVRWLSRLWLVNLHVGGHVDYRTENIVAPTAADAIIMAQQGLTDKTHRVLDVIDGGPVQCTMDDHDNVTYTRIPCLTTG